MQGGSNASARAVRPLSWPSVHADRFGSRLFTVTGALLNALSFGLLMILPVNFSYPVFALILMLNGLGAGLFASPNRAEIMNSVPANRRGVGAGMTATFQNSAMVLSIGVFFSLIVVGLSTHLPSAMYSGLAAQGVPDATAHQISQLPPLALRRRLNLRVEAPERSSPATFTTSRAERQTSGIAEPLFCLTLSANCSIFSEAAVASLAS